MKYLLLLNCLFLSCSLAKKQVVTIKEQSKQILLDKKKLYIVCRGTYSKSALIAEKFNIQDQNISHCGIGFIKNDGLCIYHVSDIKSSNTCLVIDSLASFRQSPDIFYLSIWACKVNAKTLKKIKNNCEAYTQKKIDFDYNFTLDSSNALYCSEFCSIILKSANRPKFNFKPLDLQLNNEFYETILNRKVLCYFPVDFFEDNIGFIKIYEWKASK